MFKWLKNWPSQVWGIHALCETHHELIKVRGKIKRAKILKEQNTERRISELENKVRELEDMDV